MQLKSMIRFYICPMRPPRIHHVYFVSPNRICFSGTPRNVFRKSRNGLGGGRTVFYWNRREQFIFVHGNSLVPLICILNTSVSSCLSQAIPKSIFVSVGLFASPILRGACVQRMLGGAGPPTFYEMPQVAPEII